VWLTSTNTMIAELVRDWSTPAGQELITDGLRSHAAA
jgi:hypothetical protein